MATRHFCNIRQIARLKQMRIYIKSAFNLFLNNRAIYTRKISRSLRRPRLTRAAYIRWEVLAYMDHGLFVTSYSLLPRFCVGCHSNRGIARAVARARKELALVHCKFASYVNRKQAAISFIRLVSCLKMSRGLFKPSSKPLVQELKPGNRVFVLPSPQKGSDNGF